MYVTKVGKSFFVLRNFAKFAGKHLCQSLFFNKATPFLTEHLWWLLLYFKEKDSIPAISFSAQMLVAVSAL